MKGKSVISLIVGLIVTGIVLGILFILYFISIFDLAGGETLQEIENQRIVLLLLSTIIAIITIVLIRKLITKKKKYTAIGIGTLPLLAFIVVCIYFIYSFNYRTSFNETSWKQETVKPFNMAATLVKDDVLIGLTRLEVKEKLGGCNEEYDNKETGRGSISYVVENNWTLTIYFINNKVADVKLRLPMMMT